MEKSAGIIVISGSEVLLAHSTRSPWFGSWMPPKGGIEEGESEEEAACREMLEECGIKVPEEILGKRHVIEYRKGPSGKKFKEVYIFECKIDSLKQIGILSLIGGEIPKFMLQEEEVSDARFMNYEEAKKRILPRYMPMLEEIFSEINQ